MKFPLVRDVCELVFGVNVFDLDLGLQVCGNVSHCRTSASDDQTSSAGRPSMRKPASREIISDSVELCETNVFFLRIQLIGTNV